MVLPGEPLVTVHYSADELTALPRIQYAAYQVLMGCENKLPPLRQPGIGLWLFELPYSWDKMKTVVKKSGA